MDLEEEAFTQYILEDIILKLLLPLAQTNRLDEEDIAILAKTSMKFAADVLIELSLPNPNREKIKELIRASNDYAEKKFADLVARGVIQFDS